MTHDTLNRGGAAPVSVRPFRLKGATYLTGDMCFATPEGTRAARDLAVGQVLLGVDGGTAQVQRLFKRPVSKTYPAALLRVGSGVLGAEQDVMISHGTPVLVDHWACNPLFGEQRLLAIAADFDPCDDVSPTVIHDGEVVQVEMDRPLLVTLHGLQVLLRPVVRLGSSETPDLTLPLMYPHEAKLVARLRHIMRPRYPRRPRSEP